MSDDFRLYQAARVGGVGMRIAFIRLPEMMDAEGNNKEMRLSGKSG